MKKLNIELKSGNSIEIFDFKVLNYSAGGPNTFTDDLSDFIIISNATYNFKGKNQVSLLGSEISYINLLKTEDD